MLANPPPGIELIVAGRSSPISADRIAALAVPVPAEVARFEGQQAVFLEDLLADVGDVWVGDASGGDAAGNIRCLSRRGESYELAAADSASFALLSTNAPSWKLVPVGRAKLHEITTPRFVLRELATIEFVGELGGDFEQPQASDQVYTNLTDALSCGANVRFLNLIPHVKITW